MLTLRESSYNVNLFEAMYAENIKLIRSNAG